MISDEQLKEVLWGILYSEHLRDVSRAIVPICEHFGLQGGDLEEILEEVKEKGLQPEWVKKKEFPE